MQNDILKSEQRTVTFTKTMNMLIMNEIAYRLAHYYALHSDNAYMWFEELPDFISDMFFEEYNAT